jgi:phospholipid N-methyltransferase
MLDWIDLSNARVVLECGPGTGSFTEEILRRRGDGCRYVGIEVNPALGRLFRERYPGLRLYETTVEKVARVCEEEGISEVDCIVSGLPWASFSEAHQTELLEAMVSVLKPGGQFATFAYLQGLLLPAGIRFRRRLRRYFGEVSASRIVWLNFPPAFVYRCRR